MRASHAPLNLVFSCWLIIGNALIYADQSQEPSDSAAPPSSQTTAVLEEPTELNPRDSWTFNLYFENDLFSETDQNYTNGLRASWISPDLVDYIDDPSLPQWLRSLNKRLTFFNSSSKGLQRNLVFAFGQTIYTPEDVLATNTVANDRPYAGWMFASVAFQSKNQANLDTLQIDLGIVGPAALGQEAQDLIHDIRGFDKFQGWDNQLKNELGLVLLYEHKQKVFNEVPRDGELGFDVITHAGIALGNVATYINAGGEVRIGWLIPNDFGTSAVRAGGDNSAPGVNWDPRFDYPDKWGFHFFASFELRAVAQDIFLDGNTFRDSHSVSRKVLVADAAVGVSSVIGRVKVSYAQVFKSKEFKSQNSGHSYGSLSLSYSF